MDLTKKLHPLEKRVVSVLKSNRDVGSIVKASGLKEVEVIRALQWLKNKNVLKVDIGAREKISLGKNCDLDKGLPERRLLNLLKKNSLMMGKTGLDRNEANVALGILKSRKLIDVDEGKISLNDKGKKFNKFEEEDFLLNLKKGRYVDELSNGEKTILRNLKKRKDVLSVNLVKERTIELTSLGRDLLKRDLGTNLLEGVDSNLIRSDLWKKKEFRAYDVRLNVPKIYPGKRHFVNQAVEHAKNIWIELGFKEMTGDIVQTGFWNFDALFVPQDHPARELQDTFYVKGRGKLKGKVIDNVKKTHENGWTTGSKGWGYKWSLDEAKRNVLRTHTTVLSAQTIANLKKGDLPAKFFSIGKVFRNETVDWSHLFELIQVEGIVIDPNANFRNLIGYLKEFFKKMGFEKVRVRPGFFPYTEPSCEVDVYHPIKKKWIELGGAGIFRPEVVKPLLGFECPVLAWGLGLERTIMDYYDIKDIREVYKNDLKELRGVKAWLK